MSLTLEAPRYRPVSRRITAAQLAALPEQLDGQSVKYELSEGELIIMAPPGGEHGRKQALITRYLITEAEDRGLGMTFSEVGIVLRRDPDTVFGPDAAFVLTASLPAKYSREGYLTTIPEIIVEVQSKNDSIPEMRTKRQEYFGAGTREVWWIHPQSQTLTIAAVDGREVVLSKADILNSPLLPGVAVPVEKLFA